MNFWWTKRRQATLAIVQQLTDSVLAISGQMDRLVALIAELQKRVARLDDIADINDPAPGIVDRLIAERNKAREERNRAEAEVNRLMMQIHGPNKTEAETA